VNGIRGLLPGGEVAAGVAAVGGRNLERVVPIDVALRAGHGGVLVSQRKTSSAVVELAVGPSGDGMAGGALRGSIRKTRSDVIGHAATDSGRLVPVRGMTPIAIR